MKAHRETVKIIAVIDRANRLTPDGENFSAAVSRARRQLQFEKKHPFLALYQKIRGITPYDHSWQQNAGQNNTSTT